MSNEPIIAGFHPDPSICRVGDTYYLANSSFEYRPGVPIFRSTDLTTWEQIGNAFTRETQMPPSAGEASSGIYAPTLRHRDGLFYLVTTNVDRFDHGHVIITATDPAGPWSDAVHVTGTIGIDPDLAWDEDGICHLTWASFAPGLHGIATAPIDPSSGALLAEPRLLWSGTGLAAPEAPHLYRVGDYWYLMLAEGGTERGHAITIARARTLDGPFEEAPSNPILTHRSTSHPVQNTGHGDLVQRPDGTWALVYLAVRPTGITPGFHVNGRETFVADVDWQDGWPVIDDEHPVTAPSDHSFTDHFDNTTFDPRWVSPAVFPGTFSDSREGGGLVLTTSHSTQRPLLCTRVRDPRWEATVALEVPEGSARFVVRIDPDHWYGLTLGEGAVTAEASIGPAKWSLGSAHIDGASGVPVELSITAADDRPTGAFGVANEPDVIVLAVIDTITGQAQTLAELPGRYLSTEVAGGFTGRVVGIETIEGTAIIHRFTYRTIANVGNG